MKRHLSKQIRMIIVLAFCIVIFPMRAQAEENAIFHVQSAEVKEDGTISISVYLTDTDHLGGIDAELVYDSSKVTYIGSGLGKSFSDGYGETTHLSDAATVKCVLIYPETKTAHGELMYATFKLNGVESYQPEFRVVDLLDGSGEIQPIPYSITYQQADGNWMDTQDTSGKKAADEIIAEARGAYGAEGDPIRRIEESVAGEKSAEELMEENGQNLEAKNEDLDGKNNTESTEDSKKEEKTDEKTVGKKGKNYTFPALIGAAMIVVFLLAVYLRKRKK